MCFALLPFSSYPVTGLKVVGHLTIFRMHGQLLLNKTTLLLQREDVIFNHKDNFGFHLPSNGYQRTIALGTVTHGSCCGVVSQSVGILGSQGI